MLYNASSADNPISEPRSETLFASCKRIRLARDPPMSESQRSAAPWWAPGGPSAEAEECSFCLGLYAYELQVRCADCDRPMCPVCAVSVRRREVRICFDCEEGEAGG